MKRSAALIVALMSCGAHAAADYHVGPGAAYASLQNLFDHVTLGPGDRVFVAGDHTYPGDIDMTSSGSASQPITVIGERVNGLRPVLSGGQNTIVFDGADHVVLQGFEITGGTRRCVQVISDDVTLRDIEVHDCREHGIISAESAGSMTIEFADLHDIGTAHNDSKHTIYAQTDEVNHRGATFRLRFSYLHNGSSGNLVKSRAERTELHYNWIEGAKVQEIEMLSPDPCSMDDPCQDPRWTDRTAQENGEMVGNVIVHTGSASQYAVRLGGDGTGAGSAGFYRLVNNTFVFAGGGTALRLFAQLRSVEAHNNVFTHRSGGGSVQVFRDAEAQWVDGNGDHALPQISGSDNWVEASATAIPPGWTGTLVGPGSDPGFVDIAASDFVPRADSVLHDRGNPAPQSAPGFSFPNPLALPLYLPPSRLALAPGAQSPRTYGARVDIGAFDPPQDLIFANGFDQ